MVFRLVDKGILLADQVHHKENLQKIRKILQDNCYPPQFVNDNINSRVRKLKQGDDVNEKMKLIRNQDPVAPFVVLPYQGESSTKLSIIYILNPFLYAQFLKLTTN